MFSDRLPALPVRVKRKGIVNVFFPKGRGKAVPHYGLKRSFGALREAGLAMTFLPIISFSSHLVRRPGP